MSKEAQKDLLEELIKEYNPNVHTNIKIWLKNKLEYLEKRNK